MATAEWTPTAKRELDDIHDFIGVSRCTPRAAANLVREIYDKANLYATQPEMGAARDDLGEGFRVFTVKAYVVVYRASRRGIEVLRVVDGRRDYPVLFSELTLYRRQSWSRRRT